MPKCLVALRGTRFADSLAVRFYIGFEEKLELRKFINIQLHGVGSKY